MQAEIITIGDEILIGQVVDTNSAWIAGKFNEAGITVKQITSVSDNAEHIIAALSEAKTRASVIIITGGLGPTKDDITKKTLAGYFGVGLKRDEAAFLNVERIFKRLNRPLLEINARQADVPENCKVLLNENGTAPGMWFEEEDFVFVSLPGVPFEMMYLIEEKVIPALKAHFRMDVIVHQTILTAGIGESFLAEQIADIEDSLPSHIKLAYLPKLGVVRLRLSGTLISDPDHQDENRREQLINEINTFKNKIVQRAGEYVFAESDLPFEKALLDYMSSRGLTLAVAESCTGGYISQQLTQHPGSSKVFLGGAVTYSNQLKQIILGVNAQTLEEFGAVSEQTVKEMARGALERFDCDYSIAVSGIAGPGGGTSAMPVGTIWISVASKNQMVAQKFQFGNKRQQNIERAAINALTMLFKVIRKAG